MKPTHLYCQPACARCQRLAHQLHESGIEVVVSDVTGDPDAFDAVADLGYCSLPVLIAPDGTSAAGATAAEWGARPSRNMSMFVDANVPSGTLNNKRSCHDACGMELSLAEYVDTSRDDVHHVPSRFEGLRREPASIG